MKYAYQTRVHVCARVCLETGRSYIKFDFYLSIYRLRKNWNSITAHVLKSYVFSRNFRYFDGFQNQIWLKHQIDNKLTKFQNAEWFQKEKEMIASNGKIESITVKIKRNKKKKNN